MYLYVSIESTRCCKLNVIKTMRFNCITFVSYQFKRRAARFPRICIRIIRMQMNESLILTRELRTIVIGYDAKFQDQFALIVTVQLHQFPASLRNENDVIEAASSGSWFAG